MPVALAQRRSHTELSLTETSQDWGLVLNRLASIFNLSLLQVIIGFVGTGYLVLLLVIFDYLVSYDPTQSPWPGQEDRYRWRANPIDVVFLRWIRRIKPTDPKPFRGPASYLQRSIDNV